MLKQIFFLVALLTVCVGPTANAGFIEIENIGTVPIVSINLEIVADHPAERHTRPKSHQPRIQRVPLPSISRKNPLLPGEVVRIFELPELKTVGFAYMSLGMKTAEGLSVGNRMAIKVIPDNMVIEEQKNTSVGLVGARLTFRSGVMGNS